MTNDLITKPVVKEPELAPNLLRPEQVKELKDTKQELEAQAKRPDVRDRASLHRQLKGIDHQLETQAPKEFPAEVKDKAAARIAELESKIREDMPTAAEMRAAPSGAVNKELKWRGRHRADVAEWKHLQLRMNADTDDNEVANVERLRPVGGSGEMNVNDGIVARKDFHFGSYIPPITNVMSDADREAFETQRSEDARMIEAMKKLNPKRQAAIKAELSKVED